MKMKRRVFIKYSGIVMSLLSGCLTTQRDENSNHRGQNETDGSESRKLGQEIPENFWEKRTKHDYPISSQLLNKRHSLSFSVYPATLIEFLEPSTKQKPITVSVTVINSPDSGGSRSQVSLSNH
ncbi:MAG: hypothetical protein SXQ77_13030, partial [Halobacteria archaeon]|nr:hypothetical protein [Halobacteria archaeon]